MNRMQHRDVYLNIFIPVFFRNFAHGFLARPMAERTPNPVFEVVPENVLQVKIADLGNACWTVDLLSKNILPIVFFFFSSFYPLVSTFH